MFQSSCAIPSSMFDLYVYFLCYEILHCVRHTYLIQIHRHLLFIPFDSLSHPSPHRFLCAHTKKTNFYVQCCKGRCYVQHNRDVDSFTCVRYVWTGKKEEEFRMKINKLDVFRWFRYSKKSFGVYDVTK